MSEVPEDITQAATRAIYRMPDRRDENINTSDFWDLIVLEVEKVILAERDQCAKIAEDRAAFHKEEASVCGDSDYGVNKVLQWNFDDLSDRIRRR